MAEKLLLLCSRMGAKDAVAVELVTVGMGRTGGALETLLCRFEVLCVGTVDADIELRRAVRFSRRVPAPPSELLLLR